MTTEIEWWDYDDADVHRPAVPDQRLILARRGKAMRQIAA
jgi:hypothetical protein